MLPWLGVFDNLQFQVQGDHVILSGQVTRPTLRENDVPVLGPLIRDESSLNASLSAAGAPPVTGVPPA